MLIRMFVSSPYGPKKPEVDKLGQQFKKQVRFHPHVVWSSLARTDESWVPGPLRS